MKKKPKNIFTTLPAISLGTCPFVSCISVSTLLEAAVGKLSNNTQIAPNLQLLTTSELSLL